MKKDKYRIKLQELNYSPTMTKESTTSAPTFSFPRETLPVRGKKPLRNQSLFSNDFTFLKRELPLETDSNLNPLRDEAKQEKLRKAVTTGSIEVVNEYLNDVAVDVNGQNEEGVTALHYACQKGHEDIAKLLLSHGADIEAMTNFNKFSPLLLSCYYGHASLTKLLLARGCKLNAVDFQGCTSLHRACKRGNAECVEELLAHGADTTMRNSDGKTPFDLARGKKHFCIVALLTKHKNRWRQPMVHSSYDPKEFTLPNAISPIAEDQECQASDLKSWMSSKVKGLIDSQWEELRRDMIASKKEETTQTVKELSCDLEFKVKGIIDHRCEVMMSDMLYSKEEERNQIIKQLSTDIEPKLKSIIDSQCEAMRSRLTGSKEKEINETIKKISGDLESKVETIIDRRYEELKIGQDKIKSSFEDLTSQLTVSNTQVANYVSKLYFLVKDLDSKVSTNEVQLRDKKQEELGCEKKKDEAEGFEIL